VIERLIPLIYTIAGAAIGFLSALIRDSLQRKADAEERFFNEAYRKRIAVYEEIIGFLSKITNREVTLNAPPVPAAEIFEYIHTLENLLDKLAVFGNYAFRNPLDVLLDKFVFMYKNVQAGLATCEAGSLRPFIVKASDEFVKLVRAETGANFVDKRIGKIPNLFAEVINKPGGDKKGKITNHI
jgi:hypothetical protein